MAVDLDYAEQSLLGAVLLSNGSILKDLDFNPTDYRHPVYETIHRTAQNMHTAGKPVDVVTVMGEMQAAGERFDPTLLHQAVANTPTEANADYYAGIVADAATGRRLTNAAARITEMVNTGGDMPEIVEAARKEVDRAQSTARQQPVTFIGDTIEETIDALDAPINAIPTPWPSLNEIITGFMPGAVYVIGARPGVGKSVVGMQCAQAMLHHGSVAFISLEMSRDDLNQRLISSELKINMGNLVNRNIHDDQWVRIGEWVREQPGRPLAVLDNAGATITDIKRFVRSVGRRRPLAGIVVDYLQLLNPPPGDKRPRHEYVAAMSRELKILAMEHQVPVILLSQLNRGSTQREDQRPMISDLRESGAIEQDADVVILLHRVYPGPNEGEISFGVAKNRRGKTGKTDLAFWGHYSTIREP
jgi:replicative DNA helicase